MNCREFVEFLDRYLEADLPAGERSAFDEHIAECPACVHYLDGYRKSMQAVRKTLELEQLVSAAPRDLLAAILAAREKKATDL